MAGSARRTSTSKNRGSTLTEILVAVVVLTIGMVVVAGMLNNSISSLTNSLQRQRAALLSADLAELVAAIPADTTWSTHTPADYGCNTVACTPTELLAHTLHHWQRRVALRLPNGRGNLQFVDDDGLAAAAIRLEWHSRGGSQANFVTLIPVTTPTEPL